MSIWKGLIYYRLIRLRVQLNQTSLTVRPAAMVLVYEL